jgi:hypothetical protein
LNALPILAASKPERAYFSRDRPRRKFLTSAGRLNADQLSAPPEIRSLLGSKPFEFVAGAERPAIRRRARRCASHELPSPPDNAYDGASRAAGTLMTAPSIH